MFIKIDDLVDINTIVSFQWTKDGMIVQENSGVTINFITIIIRVCILSLL